MPKKGKEEEQEGATILPLCAGTPPFVLTSMSGLRDRNGDHSGVTR